MLSLVKSRLTKFVALTSFTLALAFFSFSVPLRSNTVPVSPPCSSVTEFYSEASHTNLVGERYINCSGPMTGWGIITNYQIAYTTGSCPGHGIACD